MPVNITVRKCMISDAPRIRELSRQLLGFDYPEDKFEANIRRLMTRASNLLIVAENNGTMLGFAHACDFDILYGPHLKILRAIAVDEKYRSYGAGKKLLEAVEDWAKRTGASGVRIYSGSERTAAIGLYKACGYEFVKPETKYKKDF